MARTRVLQSIHTGKVAYILLGIVAVLFIADHRSNQSLAFAGLKISGQTDELLHLSKIKRGKALSYLEDPYQQSND